MAPPTLARGLKNFIDEIKMCKTPAEESRRVMEELVKIKGKFQGKGGKREGLSSYDLAKYVSKLCYIEVLGYGTQEEIGANETVQLLSSPKLKEKALGYVAALLLVTPGMACNQQLVSTMFTDLGRRGPGSYDPRAMALAYCMTAEGLDRYLPRIAHEAAALIREGNEAPKFARKKACLCLASLATKGIAAEGLDVASLEADLTRVRVAQSSADDIGLATCAARALATSTSQSWMKAAAELLCYLEEQKCDYRTKRPDAFHGVLAPFLRLALVESLAKAPYDERLGGVARLYASTPEYPPGKRDINGTNAARGLRFAWLVFGAKYPETRADCVRAIIQTAWSGSRDANEQVAALRALAAVAAVPGACPLDDKIKSLVDFHLKHADESCQKSALRLAMAACDARNASEVCQILLGGVATADKSVKIALGRAVLKIVEEHAPPSAPWLVNVVARLAVDYGAYEVDWRYAVSIIKNKGLLHEAAALSVKLLDDRLIGDSALRFCAVVLAEYFPVRATRGLPPADHVLDRLHSKFMQTQSAKTHLLTAMVKLAAVVTKVRGRVVVTLDAVADGPDAKLGSLARDLKSDLDTGDLLLLEEENGGADDDAATVAPSSNGVAAHSSNGVNPGAALFGAHQMYGNHGGVRMPQPAAPAPPPAQPVYQPAAPVASPSYMPRQYTNDDSDLGLLGDGPPPPAGPPPPPPHQDHGLPPRAPPAPPRVGLPIRTDSVMSSVDSRPSSQQLQQNPFEAFDQIAQMQHAPPPPPAAPYGSPAPYGAPASPYSSPYSAPSSQYGAPAPYGQPAPAPYGQQPAPAPYKQQPAQPPYPAQPPAPQYQQYPQQHQYPPKHQYPPQHQPVFDAFA